LLFDWRCAALGIEAEILLRSAALPRDKQKIGAESPTPAGGSAQYLKFPYFRGVLIFYASAVIMAERLQKEGF
jgi:hypothetical protein